MYRSILIICCLFSFQWSFAQADDDYVKANTYYFEVSDSDINGEGADILKQSIEASQFFILGEEHFSAKISQFTNAIIPSLAAANYKYFAAEIGPNSATKITNVMAEKGSLYDFNTEIYRLIGDIPVPFFDGKEDEVFLKNALNSGLAIWGIDQEFLTAQVFLIDEIFELSKNKTEIRSSYKKVKTYLIETSQYENNDPNLFTKFTNSTLINQFFESTDPDNADVQKIIADLRESWEVYRLREVKDYYTSLHKRLEIMQNNFIDYYTEALKIDALPKAIIKIGGVHASKGRSVDNIYDIGNFVMELANYNRQQSTSALIYPIAYLNDDGSIDNNINEKDAAYIQPLIDESDGQWILIDLKKIAQYSWKNKIEYASLKEYMYRFDYLILTPPSKSTIFNYKE